MQTIITASVLSLQLGEERCAHVTVSVSLFPSHFHYFLSFPSISSPFPFPFPFLVHTRAHNATQGRHCVAFSWDDAVSTYGFVVK